MFSIQQRWTRAAESVMKVEATLERVDEAEIGALLRPASQWPLVGHLTSSTYGRDSTSPTRGNRGCPTCVRLDRSSSTQRGTTARARRSTLA